MENLNKEKAFLNAKVVYKNKNFYVVKINNKTVYLSEDKGFIIKWKDRPKGITWKKFCEKHKTVMVSYDKVKIDNLEMLRATNFIVSKKKGKNYLDSFLEKEVRRLFMVFLKKKGSWKYPIENKKNEQMFIIKFNDNGQSLIRFKDIYFFYDIEFDVYTFYKNLGEKLKSNRIPWPRNEEEAEIKNKKVS
jgi:hypothetical protein